MQVQPLQGQVDGGFVLSLILMHGVLLLLVNEK